ncbi:InlB B-repeat-containing protein [Anaerophaga thermohalophila]|uniref:InlB B-repeat-containing protein n=1 Tax=Anaerophaga thermohalophila TaxID=177400 RepID=UPI000237BE53|nr:InlB B-repeat-containing protein [Anaerophaga thermohalophila]
MKELLPLLSFLVILNFGISYTNAQSYETTVMTGETYSTASYVGYYHGHRANLYKAKDGTFHMAVVDNYELKYLTSSDNGQTWTEQSVATEYDGKVSDVMIKGDVNGNIFLVVSINPAFNYGAAVSGSSQYFWRNIYVFHNLTGSWVKEPVSTPSASAYGNKIIRDLLISNDGTVHLITIYYGWGDYGGKAWEFRRDPNSGAWSTITIANYNDTSVDHGMGFFPAIIQEDGSIAGIYWRNKGSGELGYRTCPDGSWDSPVVISPAAHNRQDICRHPDGNPRIVYTTNATPQQIMYKSTLDNSPGTPIYTLEEGQIVNAVKIHANGFGKETVIINVEDQRTIYAEKYPEDETWPATFQQVPLTEEGYWPSTVSAPNDTLVNFSCTYLDFNPGPGNGPHGPNTRYFFSIPDKRTLSLEASPQEGGTVSGEGEYIVFSTQTIEATPETGYQFIQWSENGQFVSASAQTDIEMFDHRTLTAEFQPVKDHTISLLVNEPVHGNISGAGTYTDGESVTISATPDEGYHFINWTEGETEVSTSAEYTFSATEDKVLTANFEINQYTLTTEANNTLYGLTTGDGIYDYATEVSVEAFPEGGYGFSHWVSNSDSVSSDNPLIFDMLCDTTLTAIFKEQYAITATTDPVDVGTVEGTGDYLIGETITLTAIPENLFSFSHWSEDGITISNEAEITFTVDGARNLTAHFVPWFAGGTGTSEDPFLIETPEHLNNVRNFLEQSGVHFKMIADIDLDVAPYNEGNGWLPIGDDYYNSFRGTFDGDGHTISNLYINRSIMNVGLFGLGQYATIENLNLTNINLTGSRRVGGIFAAHYYGTTRNCSVEGVIKAGDYGGGIAGRDMGTVSQCYTNVDVTGSYVGSLIGYKDNGTATNCYGTGTISTTYRGGGLIGHLSSSTINNCYSLTQVNGSGGLIGYVYSSYTINNSYFPDNEPNNNLGEAIPEDFLRCSQTYAEWDFSTIWDIQPDKNNGYPFLRWQTPETTPVTDLTDFSIDQDNMSLSVGETYQLSATFTPTDATLQCLDWSTDDENIVTINPTGFIEVAGPGTATLSAYHSGLDATKSITVTSYYQVDVLSDPDAGGTVSGAGQYENNALVSLSATANSGYDFTEWSEGGTIFSSDNPLTFNATGNHTITAHFVPVHNIIIQTANGSVEVSNDASEVIVPDDEETGSYILHEGLVINLEATPDAGYHFLEWQEEGSAVSTDNPYSIIVSEDRTLNAVFEINAYNLNYSAGENGSISGDTPQTVDHGQDGTEVTAVPDEGYHFCAMERRGYVCCQNRFRRHW